MVVQQMNLDTLYIFYIGIATFPTQRTSFDLFFFTSFKSCIGTEGLRFLTSVYGIYILPFQLSCFTSAEMGPCHVIPRLTENKKVQLSQVTQMTVAYLIPLQILASTHHQEDLYTA